MSLPPSPFPFGIGVLSLAPCMGNLADLSSMSPVGLSRTWISLKLESVVSLSSGGLDSVVEEEPPLSREAGTDGICDEDECA